ncbi:MAG TPA: succinoglycan biosynthesis ketolase [Cyanobacteria bacterium UBA12227]|nr:succinoglycan biosynthesis ketolase [Cyanobacteria bacterium UBA12227]HAX86950.1 succinoglycan biosynthesis ketolase [Cyanobacteria bacterium UBA11370]HBY79352.1 succinoglycan biosynthesis ketolase [Cyanobacteria bacterium UBA11148]
MKLFYYQRRDKLSNFGDALNPWLWTQLLPNVFNNDESTVFVGIGTLLNNLLPHRLPSTRQIIIFSSGVGYETGLPAMDKRWKINCVRGLLSAQKLGLPTTFAVTDGAILVRRLFKPTSHKTHRFGFMPHIHHANYASKLWESICSKIGFNYIDPRWNVEQVLSAISETEILLAEAMHGAIVADALRVPWIPICTSARILAFKWHDWCSSIEVEYQPNYLMPLFDSYPPIAQGIRSSINASRYWLNCFKQDPFIPFNLLGRDKYKLISTQLIQIAQTTRPILSDDQRIEHLTVELEERLSRLCF